VAGFSAAPPDDVALDTLRARAQSDLGPPSVPRPKLRDASWPPLVQQLLDATSVPRPLGAVLSTVAAEAPEKEALRGVELLLTANLVAWGPG
jgi:hypothetical protein